MKRIDKLMLQCSLEPEAVYLAMISDTPDGYELMCCIQGRGGKEVDRIISTHATREEAEKELEAMASKYPGDFTTILINIPDTPKDVMLCGTT